MKETFAADTFAAWAFRPASLAGEGEAPPPVEGRLVVNRTGGTSAGIGRTGGTVES